MGRPLEISGASRLAAEAALRRDMFCSASSLSFDASSASRSRHWNQEREGENRGENCGPAFWHVVINDCRAMTNDRVRARVEGPEGLKAAAASHQVQGGSKENKTSHLSDSQLPL